MPVKVEEPRASVVGEESDGNLIICAGANADESRMTGSTKLYAVLFALRSPWVVD